MRKYNEIVFYHDVLLFVNLVIRAEYRHIVFLIQNQSFHKENCTSFAIHFGGKASESFFRRDDGTVAKIILGAGDVKPM